MGTDSSDTDMIMGGLLTLILTMTDTCFKVTVVFTLDIERLALLKIGWQTPVWPTLRFVNKALLEHSHTYYEVTQ